VGERADQLFVLIRFDRYTIVIATLKKANDI